MGNIEFYDQLAGKESRFINNGRFFGLHLFTEKKIFRDIMKKLNVQENDSVLDLGSGTGRIAKRIAPFCREIMLVDGAPNALEAAKKVMREAGNASFKVVDINSLPLPFPPSRFDKILCYSVVHSSIDSHEKFRALVMDLVRVSKPGGKILIGDIPLDEKYEDYLERRRRYPLKNFFLNQVYHGKKTFTDMLYRIKGVDQERVRGLKFTKELIRGLLGDGGGISFVFSQQDKHLPFANSREDLLITKLD